MYFNYNGNLLYFHQQFPYVLSRQANLKELLKIESIWRKQGIAARMP